MYCENCGKNYANVKYTQVINGEKKEMLLCDECSKILGIENFNIPIDFSTFLGDFFTQFEDENILPQLMNKRELRCKRCNSSFEDFINTGRFGCPECYSSFEGKIDSLLKNIQGANRHVGRLGKIESENLSENQEKTGENSEEINQNLTEIDKLKHRLKLAIREEKYEEAASLRDEIKKLEGEK